MAGSSRPSSALQRRGSSGSMTERTFREPSPNRSQPVPPAVDAPPVPALPVNMPTAPTKSARRTASMDAPQLRVASPPPTRANGRGSSLGPGPGPSYTTPPRRTSQRNSGLSSVQELTGAERPLSRTGSVNFSLPTSSRPTSPYGQRQQLTSPSRSRANIPRISSPNNQNLVYDPNTRSFLPLTEVLAIEQRLQDAEQRIRDASEQPVRRMAKVAPKERTGTHLAQGSMSGRPKGTAVTAIEAASRTPQIVRASQSTAQKAIALIVPTVSEFPQETSQPTHSEPSQKQTKTTTPARPPPVEAPAPLMVPAPVRPPAQSTVMSKRKKKRVVVSEPDSDGSYSPNPSDDSDVPSNPQAFNTRAGGVLARKPSVVREDREREEEEETASPILAKPQASPYPIIDSRISASPAIPSKSAGRGHGRGQDLASSTFAEGRQHTRSASQPPTLSTSLSANVTPANGGVRGARMASVSPSRSAHFAITPENLMVRHQPPPRSISPRKSALKQSSTSSNSPRAQSPVGSADFGRRTSEASTEAAVTEVPSKHKTRVSFDEGSNVVIGQGGGSLSNSPIEQSPQVKKRGWFNKGLGKKKDLSPADDVEDDETMSPRPMLPSFGSVREKKNAREMEERPLVRPSERVGYPKITVPTSLDAEIHSTSPNGEVGDFHLGQSNDHVVGSVLQDAASRNAANISKSREPLPPQVTSVEGTGELSDDDNSSSYSLEEDIAGITRSGSVKRGPKDATADTYGALMAELEQQLSDEKKNGGIPGIAVQKATPTLEETQKRNEWPDMPGGFPNGGSSDSGSQSHDESGRSTVDHRATDPTLADIGIAEPQPAPHLPGSPVIGEIAADNLLRQTPPVVEHYEEESEDSAVYSDAVEDLSDIEGEGFLSLDAVVGSPVIPAANAFGIAISTPPDSPTARTTKERVYKNGQLRNKSEEPDPGEGWEKAQEYWASLSTEKRRQLEIEAQEQADLDEDSEDELTPVATRISSPTPAQQKIVPVQASAPVIAAQHQPALSQNRTYMIQPGSKAGANGYSPALRASMRAEPSVSSDGGVRMRKSMRGTGSMQGSVRNENPPANRPMSYPPPGIKANPSAVQQLRHISASAATSSTTAKKGTAQAQAYPALRRKGSGDSDSSFKRARSANEGISLRRSMRGRDEQNGGRQQSALRSSRFSLRSMSPTGRGRSKDNAPPINLQTTMRSSMRNSLDSPNRTKSPVGILGFGRSTSTKPTKAIRPRASRFADSSDEDEPSSTFRSRYVDSSDDDEPAPKASLPRTRNSVPVRGIPHPPGVIDGDSSDLPDSDDERGPSIQLGPARQNGTSQGTALAASTLQRSGSGRGTLVAPGTVTSVMGPPRTPHSRRPSIMSILRRKKPDSSSRVRKSDAESPARRDTPLERSASELKVVKRNDSGGRLEAVGRTDSMGSIGKLQKRHMPPVLTPTQGRGTSPWPLPGGGEVAVNGGKDGDGVEILNDEGRPSTADAVISNGNTGLERPDLGSRRITATGLGDVDLGLSPRKPKKFPRLRRMFRLDN